jgi:hypothetical protein
MGRSKHGISWIIIVIIIAVLLVKMPEIALDTLKMVFKPNIFIPAVLVFAAVRISMKAKRKHGGNAGDGNEYADGSTYENPDGKTSEGWYADGSTMKNEQDADAVGSGRNEDAYSEYDKSCYESTEKQEKQNAAGDTGSKDGQSASYKTDNHLNSKLAAFFGNKETSFENEVFEGAVLDSVFGNVELDIRNAIIYHDVAINASAVFGNVEVKVPKNCKVYLNGNPIFGSIENNVKRNEPLKTPSATITINGTCVFGEIEVK